MKKRLLITSIVMMLVVAVALSTATYAWFTSNANVTANQVLLTASTMDGQAIMISHSADNSSLNSSIVLTANNSLRLYPATPNAADALTAPTAEKFINLQVDGTNQAKKQTITSPTASYYTDTFYVYNKGSKEVTLTPTVNIYFNSTIGSSSDAAQSVRVAIVESKGTEVGTGNITFADPVLKNIYQYDVTAASTTTVNVTTYIAAPSTWDESITNYYKDNAGTAWDGAAITDSNYDEYKSQLFVVEATTTDKNVAIAGALTGYGAETADAEPTANSVYTQKNDLSYTSAGFQKIAAPSSNHYVANKYTVIVWLEGWDTECTNAMSAGLFRIDLSFAA